MEQWYEELDFEENPFSTNPSDFVKNLVGREDVIDELIYRVRSGSIVFLEGDEGMGKSSLLRNVVRKFRGKGKVIFVNCEKLEKGLNIEELLVMRNGLIKGVLLKKYPTNMILLLDNVSKLSKVNSERIKYFFDQGYLKSVIVSGKSFADVEFSDSLKQRVSKVITLKKLEEYQAVDMIRSRIGDIKFLSDEIIELIAEVSGYVPKIILKNCEEISEYVINIDEDVVKEEHVKQVLGKHSTIPEKTDSEVKDDVVLSNSNTDLEEEETSDVDDSQTKINNLVLDNPNESSEEGDVSVKEASEEESEKVEEDIQTDVKKKEVVSDEDFDSDFDDDFDDESVKETHDHEFSEEPSEKEMKKKESISDDFDDDDDFDDFDDDDDEIVASEKVEEPSKEIKKEKKESASNDFDDDDDDFFDDDFEDDDLECKNKKGDDDA